jgi:hypothetical protein
LPRVGGGNDHINAEAQIKLGKITATAVEGPPTLRKFIDNSKSLQVHQFMDNNEL